LDQATVLIVSDEAEFSRAITGRWQSERTTPTFTLMSGDLCQAPDGDAFDIAIVGGLRRGGLSAVLKALDPAGKPVLLICEETQTARETRDAQPRIMALRQYEGWLDALVLIVSEALRRSEATKRLRRTEQENALLQQQATLGTYMREMLHNLNNALTSVLGNSELLLL
jgi:signal transduction histidine kinase